MRSYPVKKNPIGSMVSEILRYRQTDKHYVTLLEGNVLPFNFPSIQAFIPSLTILFPLFFSVTVFVP